MTASSLIIPPPLQFALDLGQLQVDKLGNSEGLTTMQSDGIHIEGGLSFNTGLKDSGFPYNLTAAVLNTLNANFSPQTLTFAEDEGISLSAGEQLVIDYDFIPGDLHANDFAASILKDQAGNLVTYLLASVQNYKDTKGVTHFQRTYNITATGTYDLLLASLDTGDNLEPSSLNVHSISISVPTGNYAITAGGIQLSDGTVFRSDGSSLAPGGLVTPSLLSATAGNLISTLQTDLAGGLISQDGNGIVAQGGGNIVAQGGGNIVAQGGGNIVAQGGGNLISQDGSGLVGEDGSSLVGEDGSSLVGEDGSSLIQRNASGLISQDGGGILGGNELHVLDLDSQGLLPRQFTDVAPTPPPIGPGTQFLISPGFTPNIGQGREKVTALSNGKFVVAWIEGNITTHSVGGVQVQLLNADGTKAGPVFTVPGSALIQPNDSVGVVALANGGYALTYAEYVYADTPPYGYTTPLHVQIFDASGAAVGGPSDVGPAIPALGAISATSLSDGSFAILETENPGAGQDIARAVQVVTAGGVAKLPLITIAEGDVSSNAGISDMAVAALADGAFALTYTDGSGSDFGLYYQVVDADGTVNAPILIEPGRGSSSSLAVLTDGNIVIAWPDAAGVVAQIVTPAGVLVGNEIVTEYNGQIATAPALTALSDGRFMIAYSLPNPSNPNSSFTVDARYFNADGTPSGDYFAGAALDSQTFVTAPVATQLADGTIEIVSTHQGENDQATAIFAEQVVPNVPPAPGVPGTEFAVSPGVSDGIVKGQKQVAALSDGRFAVAWVEKNIISGGQATGINVQLMNANGTPAGSAFAVSGTPPPMTQFTGFGDYVAVAALSDGGYALTYLEYDVSAPGPPYPSNHLRVQIFDANGTAVGAPTDLGEPLKDGNQLTATPLSDGTIMITEMESGGYGTHTEQAAVRVSGSGTELPFGQSDPIVTIIGGPTLFGGPATAALSNGAFAWAYVDINPFRGLPTDFLSNGLLFQVIQANGTVSTPVLITAAGAEYPSMAVLTNGDMVLAWFEGATGGASASVHARVFTQAGVLVGGQIVGEFAAASDLNGNDDPMPPAITALNDGRFMIAYSIANPDNPASATGVNAQIYNSDGTLSFGHIAGAAPDSQANETFPVAVQLVGGTVEIVSTHQDNSATGSSITAVPITIAGDASNGTAAPTQQGRAVDGYISGATVFADADGDGLLSPGEASAITDSLGRYSFTTPASGTIILTGGTDVSTGLAFTETLTAPAGALTITPLTTLVQKIEATNGGDLVLAERQVNADFGLAADTDVTALDPLRSAAAGSSNGAAAFIGGAIVADTVALATAAGATGDLYALLAAQVEADPVSFDPTSVAAMQALGLTGTVATDTAALAQTSKALLTQPLTWSGAIGTDLSTAGDWNPSVAPNGTQPLAFALSAGGTLTGQVSGLSATFSGPGGWLLQDATAILAGDQSGTTPLAVSDTGNLTVDGGSISGSGELAVESGSGGAVAAQGGAQLTFTGVSVGADVGQIGSLRLSAASSLLNFGGVSVGASGSGHVVVTGTATLSDGAVDTIGGNTGGAGDLTVSAGGQLSDAGLIVGGSGSGQATINGGSLASSGLSYLGQSAGGTGSASVIAGTWTAAGVVIGGAGAGLLSIGAGGTVSSGAGIDVAASPGSTGDVIVAGAASVLSNAGTFVVGDLGLGSLEIRAGGTVITNPGADVGGAGAIIARTQSASGASVNVVGAGANWQVTGALVVGAGGFGSMSLAQGGAASVGSLDEGTVPGGGGGIVISGTGTTLTVTGALTIGDQATGEFAILGGAQVTIGGGLVGGTGGGSGNLDVEDTGSRLTINGGTLVVGATGPAVYTLGQGTTQTGAERTAVFGIANLGGLQDPPYITNDSASSSLNSGYVGEADIAVRNSGTYTVKPQSGTFAPPTVYSPDITFDPDPTTSGGSTNGVWVIQSLGTLVLNATTVDASQVVDFGGINAAKLVIGQVPETTSSVDADNAFIIDGSIAQGSPNVLAGFAAPIQNYQSGDVIVLRGLTYGSATASGDVVTVWSGTGGTGTALGSLTFLDKKGNDTGVTVVAEALAASVQLTAAALACFAEGTRIATADGPVAVERLKIGDLVLTANGGREAIVWVGSRSVDCARHPEPRTVWPVRVRAGAFGENVPVRDLFLSPDHAVFVNDVLIPVKLLINGTSIAQAKRRRVTYYHVELPEHAVILAEDLPVESYLDTGDRANFVQTDGAIRLFPNFATPLTPDAALAWETRGAAPLVLAGERFATAQRAVIDNAGRTGHGIMRPISGTR